MDDIPGFSKEHSATLRYVYQRTFREIPSLDTLWNPASEASMNIAPFDPEQSKSLSGYIESLFLSCAQGLYAIRCLEGFSTHESSNITEFFVAHYLVDFIIRVKTGTDLLALMLNRIYELNLDDKKCSLESGAIVASLKNTLPGTKALDILVRELDRTRTEWLSGFDVLRDIAIHRAGFKFTIVSEVGYPVHITFPIPETIIGKPFSYDPDNPLDALKPHIDHNNPLGQFLAQIKSKSVSKYITIDPLSFCEEVWNKWSGSTEKILSLCKEDLLIRLRG